VFDIAYVGTTGTHLPQFRQVDQDYNTAAELATFISKRGEPFGDTGHSYTHSRGDSGRADR